MVDLDIFSREVSKQEKEKGALCIALTEDTVLIMVNADNTFTKDLKISCITGKISTLITYHLFSLDKEYLSAANKVDKYLGSEIDLMFKYKAGNEILLQDGYSFCCQMKLLKLLMVLMRVRANLRNSGGYRYYLCQRFIQKPNRLFILNIY